MLQWDPATISRRGEKVIFPGLPSVRQIRIQVIRQGSLEHVSFAFEVVLIAGAQGGIVEHHFGMRHSALESFAFTFLACRWFLARFGRFIGNNNFVFVLPDDHIVANHPADIPQQVFLVFLALYGSDDCHGS